MKRLQKDESVCAWITTGPERGKHGSGAKGKVETNEVGGGGDRSPISPTATHDDDQPRNLGISLLEDRCTQLGLAIVESRVTLDPAQAGGKSQKTVERTPIAGAGIRHHRMFQRHGGRAADGFMKVSNQADLWPVTDRIVGRVECVSRPQTHCVRMDGELLRPRTGTHRTLGAQDRRGGDTNEFAELLQCLARSDARGAQVIAHLLDVAAHEPRRTIRAPFPAGHGNIMERIHLRPAYQALTGRFHPAEITTK